MGFEQVQVLHKPGWGGTIRAYKMTLKQNMFQTVAVRPTFTLERGTYTTTREC